MIPCFNDWASLRLLLPQISQAVSGLNWRVSILVINDASTEPVPDDFESHQILNLRCNLGHQRAIALGLYHAHEFTGASAVVVMDGDGEDRPQDLPALLAEFELGGCREAVFAARTKRMESTAFQISYQTYRMIHRMLTGIEVRAGNFSVLPRSALTSLMVAADVWNHYAASVYRSRLPRRLLPLPRGSRLCGQSHMNFVSLLVHGLSAMSVFSDRISARLLAAASLLTGLGLAIFFWVGWTPATILLLALAGQSLTFAALFALTIVSRRSSVGFLLIRDAQLFLGDPPERRAVRDGLRTLSNKMEQEDQRRVTHS